jgi:hypothetical protein
MAYTSVTRATLRSRLQDRYTGDPFWATVEANDAINEAMRQFNLFTGFWRGTATATTTANVPFVTVPATLTYRTRVYVSGRPLTRKSIVEFYRMRRDWRTQTTASGSPVPTTVREWAPIGLGQVAIWPADAAGGLTLSFDAVKATPILTADGDFLDLGEEEIGLLLDESLWILSFKQPSRMDQLRDRHVAFLQGCLARNDQLRGSSYFRSILGLDQQRRLEPERVPTDEVPPEPSEVTG